MNLNNETIKNMNNINNTYRLPHLFKLYHRCLKVGVYALFLFVFLSSCADDLEQTGTTGQGQTATLELSLSVPPMLETKAIVCEADSGSEARKAGFYYEMQVLTTDTMHTDDSSVGTKAAASLKNVYAFLFKSDGTFNGRATLATAGVGSNLLLVFTNIADASAANGRLVVIANDNAATVNYASSTAFASFSGTYAAFQDLILTSDVKKDPDIPYVGSTTVSLSGGVFTAVSTVQLYRMLAKIVVTRSISVTGGVSFMATSLFNVGNKYFGTPNNSGNGYDGTGSSTTVPGRYIVSEITGVENVETWYVGENVQSTTANAAYIQMRIAKADDSMNLNPSIGEEFNSGYSFIFKVYLNNTALRRNNVYNVTVKVSGTLDRLLEIAESNENVSVTLPSGGLNIGQFGGVSGYTTGTGTAPTITGSYTKNLLLQPNTTGTTATDNVLMKWSDNTSTQLQTETRKYWDHTYTLAHIDKTAGLAYDYCYNLTIGEVAKGTWYLPTQAQLAAIWGILRGIQANSSYADYSAFYADRYWSATGYSASNAWYVNFSNGYMYGGGKTDTYRMRCVRDL